jgi:hypothetical protein
MLRLTLCALALMAFAGSSHAQLLDPATLQIGSPPAGGDPNLIGNDVHVFQNSGGAQKGSLSQPWLLIVGIANDTSGTFFNGLALPTVTTQNPVGGPSVAGSAALGGAAPSYISPTPSPGWDPTTGAALNPTTPPNNFVFNTSFKGDAYSFIGLTNADTNSNNFGNWSTAAKTDLGLTVTSYGLYVFEITADLLDKGVTTISFNGELPVGTMAIAYGQDATHVFDTPFTESGLVRSTSPCPFPPCGPNFTVPAPSSAVLLGIGVVVFGLLGWSRRRLAPVNA